MTIPLLVAALVVSGGGVWMSRHWRVWGQVMMGLGGLGLIGVLALQVRQAVFSPQPKMPNRHEMAVSYGLANCLLGDLAGQSGSVVLVFSSPRAPDGGTQRRHEERFKPPPR